MYKRRTTYAAQYIQASSRVDTVRHNETLLLNRIGWLCSHAHMLCHRGRAGRSFVFLSVVVIVVIVIVVGGGGIDRAWPWWLLCSAGGPRAHNQVQPRATVGDARGARAWLDFHRPEPNGGPPRHFYLVMYIMEHRSYCLTVSPIRPTVRTGRPKLAIAKCAVTAAASKRTMAAAKK
jgi:hypothetical protein